MIKLDKDGNLVWAKMFDGSSNADAIQIQDDDHIVLSGCYRQDTSEMNVFIAKLDSNDNFHSRELVNTIPIHPTVSDITNKIVANSYAPIITPVTPIINAVPPISKDISREISSLFPPNVLRMINQRDVQEKVGEFEVGTFLITYPDVKDYHHFYLAGEENGNDNYLFNIGGDKLKTNPAGLNYSKKPQYNIRIKVIDSSIGAVVGKLMSAGPTPNDIYTYSLVNSVDSS